MDAAATLLAWYDRHARALPWRAPPGSEARPDPYRVWLSEVMLQQTTVAAVVPYWTRFVARWPTVEDLAAARDEDVMALWAGLGYYARARNLLLCARAVAGRGFPDTEEGLRALPGLGAYTAAAVAAIAFGRRAVVVDGNVERVVARVFDVGEALPGARGTLRRLADSLTPEERPGDYAQGVMDLGATICTPRSPACGVCPWAATCLARARGTQALRPVKAPRRAVPERRGTAWVALAPDGRALLETREARRMLGGTLGFPTTPWDRPGEPDEGPPLAAPWRKAGEARHGFTHFALTLDVQVARLPPGANPSRGELRPLDPAALPTLMRRVWEVARPVLDGAAPDGPIVARAATEDVEREPRLL